MKLSSIVFQKSDGTSITVFKEDPGFYRTGEEPPDSMFRLTTTYPPLPNKKPVEQTSHSMSSLQMATILADAEILENLSTMSSNPSQVVADRVKKYTNLLKML